MAVFGILLAVVDFGMFNGLRKHVSESLDNKKWRENVIGFYFNLNSIILIPTSAILIVLWLMRPDVPFFDSDLYYFFPFLVAMLIIEHIWRILQSTLLSFQLETKSEPLDLAKKFLFVLFITPLLFIDFGVAWVLSAYILSIICVCLLSLPHIVSRIDIFRLISSNTNQDIPKSRFLRYSIVTVLISVLNSSLLYFDVALLRLLTSSNITGFYNSALVIVGFVWTLSLVLQRILIHSTSEMWANNSTQAISKLASKIFRYSLITSSIVAIIIAGTAETIVPLYLGADFQPAITPLLILLPGAVGYSIARPIYSIGQGSSQIRYLILGTGTATLVNIILNILLIPLYGMTGAAVATSISYGSMLVVHTITARIIGFNPLQDARVMKSTTAVIIVASIILPLSKLLPNSVVSSGVISITTILMAICFVLLTGAVTPAEIRLFISKAKQ